MGKGLWSAGLLCMLGCSGGGGRGAGECRDLDHGIPLCGPTSVQLPLEPNSKSPVVMARIDGREARVLIDTGAEAPIISSSWLGAEDGKWLRTSELCFGELCLRGEQVFAQDTQFSQPDAESVNGFIGMRTLRHFIVEFERGDSVRFAQGSKACAGNESPLTFGPQGTPFVDVSIDGQEFPGVTIDSGSTYTVLSEASAARLDPYVSDRSELADLCTIDGCLSGVARTSAVMSYCIFDACQDDVPVKCPVFDAVGSSFLFLRHTAFDFPNSRIVFCE
ncbi:MAG TPA: hypothetical protein VHP33_02360 [Polyangiaceae bacterium]|nr:hypothetical protein [Polyangiaceae bacterium]